MNENCLNYGFFNFVDKFTDEKDKNATKEHQSTYNIVDSTSKYN